VGGDEFAKIGTPNNTGTRLLCVSGHVQKPGYYEFEVGKITMGQLLNEVCGGPLPGRKFKAVIPGGSSAKVLRFGETFTLKNKDRLGHRTLAVEDVPMDFDIARPRAGRWAAPAASSSWTTRPTSCEALANLNAFYAHESCGQCTPCREGSLWMKKITARMVHHQARAEDGALLKSVADQIAGPHDLCHGRSLFLADPELRRQVRRRVQGLPGIEENRESRRLARTRLILLGAKHQSR
jgi:NADH-quinone oxidoreductase subunit F